VNQPSAENTTEAATENKTEPESEKETEKTTETQPKKTETLGGILIAGGAAYEYYNFVQSTADEYIGVINRAAKKLSGKANVYDVIVPTSIDITLDDATRKNVSSSDQKKAIDYFYGSMTKRVNTVNIYDTLRDHRKEYIYYRTDHHWTALGAYYGYVETAKAAGMKPVDIEKFEKVSYGEFLGSFYGDSRQNKKLKKKADELIAYKPYYSTTLEYTDNKGVKYTWPLVNDVSSYNTAYKYSCFAAGDQPYVKITNNDIKSKDTCVVVKESFANAMLPYLAGNYKKVYVLDYRYWKGDFFSFIEKKGIDDVFFINNISATRNKMLVDDMAKLINGGK
ncbi:MAG: DHHW family protein, partial [Acutalibacteraceae bacterium]